MAAWRDVEDSAPEFAEAARALFDVHKHKTLATVRRDGSPRISGTEMVFMDGQIWLGSMPGSRKAKDLMADPRCAIHGPTVDPDGDWKGDVKLSGRAVEEPDQELKRAMVKAGGNDEQVTGIDFPLFRVDITEVVLTRLGDPADHLNIQLWVPGKPLRSFKR
ncbi:MAG: pyridoxamine 5'-phosphate oxidase family protein [Actinobacteria bacterium]|nr:pyridoxamine 5'-phosphate oxidase family protein [Actinomycetota bacterium]